MRRYKRTVCADCPAAIPSVPGAIRCKTCARKSRTDYEKRKRDANRAKGLCQCGREREPGFKNCPKCRKNALRHGRSKKGKDKHTKYYEQVRTAALTAYGNRCSCRLCPERHLDALEFHHVGGWGKNHRFENGGRRITGLALCVWLRKNKYPDTVSLLCGTCHTVITRKGICFHETEATVPPLPAS